MKATDEKRKEGKMRSIKEQEMQQITGGVNWVVVTFVSAAISFVIGMVDGLINPKKCNN